jgi:hypothetical protein
MDLIIDMYSFSFRQQKVMLMEQDIQLWIMENHLFEEQIVLENLFGLGIIIIFKSSNVVVQNDFQLNVSIDLNGLQVKQIKEF